MKRSRTSSKLKTDEDAVFAVFGAIKWAIIGVILALIVYVVFSAYGLYSEWVEDNCAESESIAACIAEEGTMGIVDLFFNAIAGGVAGLWGGGKKIGEDSKSWLQTVNPLTNARSIWRHYFG